MKNKAVGWRLWPKWSLIITFGHLIGFGIDALIFEALVRISNWPHSLHLSLLYLEFFIFGAVAWGMLGLSQWFILRDYVNWARNWVLVSALGGGSFLTFYAFLLPNRGVAIEDFILFGILLGFMIGSSQWLIMRRHIAQADWWVVSNTVAGATFLNVFRGGDDFTYIVSAGIIFTVLYGVITAATLIWLLRSLKVKSVSTTL